MHKLKPYTEAESTPPICPQAGKTWKEQGGDRQTEFIAKWLAENSSKYVSQTDRMLACCHALQEFCAKEGL